MVLPEVLPVESFAFLLVFARIGAVVMMMPGLGERSIPTRIKLVLALSLSLVLYFLVREGLPPIPASPLELGLLITGEVIIGLMIGGIARLALGAIHVAGSTIAVQTGLAAAQQFDPTQGSQGALVAGFLSLMAITLILVTDLHHLLIVAMSNSYSLFPSGTALPVGDFAAMAIEIVARMFLVGLQLAAPFLAYGIIFYTGIGIISRLMPQLPVFFIAMPLNIMAGFAILMLVIGAIFSWFADYFVDQISPLLG